MYTNLSAPHDEHQIHRLPELSENTSESLLKPLRGSPNLAEQFKILDHIRDGSEYGSPLGGLRTTLYCSYSGVATCRASSDLLTALRLLARVLIRRTSSALYIHASQDLLCSARAAGRGHCPGTKLMTVRDPEQG